MSRRLQWRYWALIALALAAGACVLPHARTAETPAASAPSLSPARLRGDAGAAIAQLQSELRGKLSQPRLLLGADAFRRFHRITLAPSRPAAATDRLRRPALQVELLTDGASCWLRVVDGEAWVVPGLACWTRPALPEENPSYTN